MCFGWMQDMENCFGRWDATQLLHDASLDSYVNEAFLQHQCIITWDNVEAHASHIYNTHVAPNHKTIFFMERRNRIHQYLLEPILLPAIQSIVSMRLSSHVL